jgi:hypothetical protein
LGLLNEPDNCLVDNSNSERQDDAVPVGNFVGREVRDNSLLHQFSDRPIRVVGHFGQFPAGVELECESTKRSEFHGLVGCRLNEGNEILVVEFSTLLNSEVTSVVLNCVEEFGHDRRSVGGENLVALEIEVDELDPIPCFEFDGGISQFRLVEFEKLGVGDDGIGCGVAALNCHTYIIHNLDHLMSQIELHLVNWLWAL